MRPSGFNDTSRPARFWKSESGAETVAHGCADEPDASCGQFDVLRVRASAEYSVALLMRAADAGEAHEAPVGSQR